MALLKVKNKNPVKNFPRLKLTFIILVLKVGKEFQSKDILTSISILQF